MISSTNAPINCQSCDNDFTVEAYCELLTLAKGNYVFATYDDIPWGQRFLLWRHDCDYSLNRAHALASFEADQGVRATFFLNLHSEFYNLLERSQYRLVSEIVGMGHRIGLHFDSAFHVTLDEESLSVQVRDEADLLEKVFGARPAVFSFHNPLAAHLRFEEEAYGGLVNCYSRRFKAEVPYCSDSNGYWRFRRLRDVMEHASDPCLQVLTHPGWWHEVAMPPRQRIFRCAYGRARATMIDYDEAISAHGRENLMGAAGALVFLRGVLPERHTLLDYLWMSGELAALFVELWRLHESQINNLCKAVVSKNWRVPAREVNAFFERPVLSIDDWRLFSEVFGQSLQAVAGIRADAYPEWARLRNQLVYGRGAAQKQRLEEGCVFLCEVIESLAAWGKAQSITYDGLAPIDTIGLSICKTADGNIIDRLEEPLDEVPSFPAEKWERFKVEMAKDSAGGPVA